MQEGRLVGEEHNSIVDEIAVWCDNNNAYTIKEAILPNANPDHPEARIDLIVQIPGHAPIYVDVTIVSALAQEP